MNNVTAVDSEGVITFANQPGEVPTDEYQTQSAESRTSIELDVTDDCMIDRSSTNHTLPCTTHDANDNAVNEIS